MCTYTLYSQRTYIPPHTPHIHPHTHPQLWDTNAVDCVSTFDLYDKVYTCAMSPVTASHCLIAVGTENNTVRLVDPLSGALTHSLTGHRSGVWTVAWSVHTEYTLLTGGADGMVCVWDIRRAGVVERLDPNRTTPAPPRSGGGGGDGGDGGGSGHGGRPGGMSAHKPPVAATKRAVAEASTATVAHGGAVTGLCTTPDGSHWVTGGTDNRVRLWDGDEYRYEKGGYGGGVPPTVGVVLGE